LLYRTLRLTNPAPYSAFIKIPGMAFLSSSPECFFTLNNKQEIKSEPIKGTRALGATEDLTDQIKQELLDSAKDHAELLMIIDLIRNDLSKVCEMGSVVVEEMVRLTEYPTVLQTSSLILGKLLNGKTAVDIIKEIFPGGSITGAPKLRTMNIIDAHEDRARGIYTGSIGYLSLDQAAEFNIAIRTMVYETETNTLSFGSGGAILADSDPGAEFQEILVKAYALLRAANLAKFNAFEHLQLSSNELVKQQKIQGLQKSSKIQLENLFQLKTDS
ncbi:MAG: anthranilate synthase component I family protein, partial [Bacteroidota bacterium]